MPNAPVAAAAEGMPKSTRRAFIASAAAVAAVAPASIVTAVSPASDPIFALIAAWHEADADWLAKLDRFSKAETACVAEKAYGDARIEVELCGVPFAFSTDAEISYFLRNLPNRGASATENVERMAQAGDRFRADLAAERARIETVRAKHDIAALEVASEAASDAAMQALGRAVATVPTTLAGVRALVELMAVPDRLCVGQDETGLASLASACRVLLPAA